MLVQSPVAEVSVLPQQGVIVWPRVCCCCCRSTDVGSIAIYALHKTGFGPREGAYVPYCRPCRSHYRGAAATAGESFAKVLVSGITVLLVLFLFQVPDDVVVAFFLQLLLIFGAIVWGVRRYFVALDDIKTGITPACSSAETPAVVLVTARRDGWQFRFFNRDYAEQFAAQNVSSPITPLG